MRLYTQYGPDDCYSACIASIIHVPAELVPDFVEEYGYRWFEFAQDWLGKQGWFVFPLVAESIEVIIPHVPLIRMIETDLGLHAQIWRNGRMLWDPKRDQTVHEYQRPTDDYHLIFRRESSWA